MKWRDLYRQLIISEENQPADGFNYFELMAQGEAFALQPVYYADDDAENQLADTDRLIHVEIIQVRVMPDQYQCLAITCKLVGELPSGIIRGTYTLKFENELVCEELPAEMFEDGEVPEEELSHWHPSRRPTAG
jgi:hypothetical protein